MSYLKSGTSTLGVSGPRFQNKNLNASAKVPNNNLKFAGSSFNKGSIAVYQGVKKVGKTVGAAAAPGPLNTPSLRRENHGKDVTIPLVPASTVGGVWGVSNTDNKITNVIDAPDSLSVPPPAPIVAKPAPWAKQTGTVDATSSTTVEVKSKPVTKAAKSWADAESDEDDDVAPPSAPPTASPVVYHPPSHRESVNSRPELRPNASLVRGFPNREQSTSQQDYRQQPDGGHFGHNAFRDHRDPREFRDNHRDGYNVNSRFGGHHQNHDGPAAQRFAQQPNHQQSSAQPTLAELEKNQQRAIETARQELELLEARKLRHQQQQEQQLQQLQLQIQQHQEQQKLLQQQQQPNQPFSAKGMGGIFGNSNAQQHQQQQHQSFHNFPHPPAHQQQPQFSGSGLLNSNNSDRERPMHSSHSVSAVSRPEEPVWERAKKQPIEAPSARGPVRALGPPGSFTGPPPNLQQHSHSQAAQQTQSFPFRNRSRGPSEDLAAPTMRQQVQLLRHTENPPVNAGPSFGDSERAAVGPPQKPAAAVPKSFASLFPKSTEPSIAEAINEVKTAEELAAERALAESYVSQQKVENQRDKEYVNTSPVVSSRRKMLFDDKSGKFVDPSAAPAVVEQPVVAREFRGKPRSAGRETPADKEEKWARLPRRPAADAEPAAGTPAEVATKPRYTPTAVLSRVRPPVEDDASQAARETEVVVSPAVRAQERAKERDARGPRTKGVLFTQSDLLNEPDIPPVQETKWRKSKPLSAPKEKSDRKAKPNAAASTEKVSRTTESGSESEPEEGARPRSKRLRGAKEKLRKTRKERAPRGGETVLSAATANASAATSNETEEKAAANAESSSIAGPGEQDLSVGGSAAAVDPLTSFDRQALTPSRMPHWALQPQQNPHADLDSSLSLNLGGILGSSALLLHDDSSAQWNFGSLIDSNGPSAGTSYFTPFGAGMDSALHGSGLIAQQDSAPSADPVDKLQVGQAPVDGSVPVRPPREKYVPKKNASVDKPRKAFRGGEGRGRGRGERVARESKDPTACAVGDAPRAEADDKQPHRESGGGRSGRGGGRGGRGGGRNRATDKPETVGHSEYNQSERPAKSERSDKPERRERPARPERADRPERRERPARGDKSERGDRPARGAPKATSGPSEAPPVAAPEAN